MSNVKMDGKTMVNNLLEYWEKKDEASFLKVTLPLSCAIGEPCPQTNSGLGNYPFEEVVANYVQEQCAEDRYGWKAAVLSAPAYTMVHHDHLVCGQFMIHAFGHKVSNHIIYDISWNLTTNQTWIFFPATDYSLEKMHGCAKAEETDNPRDVRHPLLLQMIEEDENLLVWDCRIPSLILSPPHCFHSVFTFDTACHLGIKVGWLGWLEETLKILDYLSRETSSLITDVHTVENFLVDGEVWCDWWKDQKNPLDDPRQARLYEKLEKVASSWYRIKEEEKCEDQKSL